MGKTIFKKILWPSCIWSFLSSSWFWFFPLNSIPVFTVKKSPWTHETVRESNSLCTPSTKHRCSSLWEQAASEWLSGAKYRISRLFRASKERLPWGRSYHTLWHRGLLSWTLHQWTVLHVPVFVWWWRAGCWLRWLLDGKYHIHGFLSVLLNSQILLCLHIGPKNTYGKYKTIFFFEIISASWICSQVGFFLSDMSAICSERERTQELGGLLWPAG